jgi:hypothetical protein
MGYIYTRYYYETCLINTVVNFYQKVISFPGLKHIGSANLIRHLEVKKDI